MAWGGCLVWDGVVTWAVVSGALVVGWLVGYEMGRRE